MQAAHAVSGSRSARTAFVGGHAVSALPVLFLLFDGIVKVLKPAPVVEATLALGIAESALPGLGLLLLLCLAIYLVPRTAALGAVLLTGYLGGAIATHVRVGSDLFSLLFPVVLGGLLWGGLYLRDARLRSLIARRG